MKTHTTHYTHYFWLPAVFLLLLVTTYYSYAPGIAGPFIFDDIPNLSPLGKHPNLSTLDNLMLFLLEGDSGPTGRPLSLASFFLNDIAWPSNPGGFIKTNILIHLLNGTLLFWFCLALATSLKLMQPARYTFSLIVSALWLLHPMQANTVLYVIQRMTELSATFMLTGLITFLYARNQFISGNMKKGIFLLLSGVGASLFLSIISKENGILLAGYILVLEFFLLSPLHIKAPRIFHFWLIPVAFLPFCFTLFYLIQSVFHTHGLFPSRDFNLTERLLSEARILFDYLHHIFAPSISQNTLFHDDYIISRNLFSPLSTLPAVIGIILLIITSFALRKKVPMVAFALAWFFTGHLLESTVIGLELYFEHRNYLPMLGFIIITGWYVVNATEKLKTPALLATATILGLFIFSVIQYADLWSKPKELAAVWFENHPNSARAQEAYSTLVRPIDKFVLPKNQFQHSKQYSYLTLLDLKQDCIKGNANASDLNHTLTELGKNPVQASAVQALSDFMTTWYSGSCKSITSSDLLTFLTQSTQNENIKANTLYLHMVYFWLYNLYFDQRDLDNVMRSLEKAYKLKPDIDLLLLIAQQLESAGLYKDALIRLNNTDALQQGLRERLIYQIRSKELETMKARLVTKIHQEKVGMQNAKTSYNP